MREREEREEGACSFTGNKKNFEKGKCSVCCF